MRWIYALALASAATVGPAAAQSSGSNAECRSNPHLARAQEQYDDLHFEDAAMTLQRALEFANNCRWDLAEIYRLKGFVDAVNNERERCHRDFEIFLALNPEYQMPPDTPPKIRNCFEDARAVAPARRSLSITHVPPGEAQPNAPVSLTVEIVDPLRLVDQVKVYFRREGVKVFTVVSARADDKVSIVIPALSVPGDAEGYRIEYLIRAVDRWDGTLAEEGNTRRPMAFAVAPGAVGGALLQSWVFWSAVGLGAVGIGVLGFVLATGAKDTTQISVSTTVPKG